MTRNLMLAVCWSTFLQLALAAPPPKATLKAKPAVERVKLAGSGGLLEADIVQKDMGITKEQIDKMAELKKNMLSDMRAYSQAMQQKNAGNAGVLDVLAGYEKLGDCILKYEANCFELLNDEQRMRLKQLRLQVDGPAHLFNRVVIRELDISAEQEDKMHQHLSTLEKPKMMELHAMLPLVPKGNKDLDKLLADQAKLRDTVRDEMLKHLTVEQKKKWETMVGTAIPTQDLLKATPAGFLYAIMFAAQ